MEKMEFSGKQKAEAMQYQWTKRADVWKTEALALILLALFGKHFDHNHKVYLWVTVCTWAASLFDFFKALPEELQILLHLDTAVELAERFLPLFSLNLGWVLPAVLGLLIGLLCQKHQKTLQAFA